MAAENDFSLCIKEKPLSVSHGKHATCDCTRKRLLLSQKSHEENDLFFASVKKITLYDECEICSRAERTKRKSPEYFDKASMVWSTAHQISDQKIDEYINLAKDTCGYNSEQALGMLFSHNYNLEQAINSLASSTTGPVPEEWSLEDKALFKLAFDFHGKDFRRFTQWLPQKSIPAIVEYYYSWKKTGLKKRRARKSAINRRRQNKRIPASKPDLNSRISSNIDSKLEVNYSSVLC